MDRADIVHDNFLRRVAAGDLPTGRAPQGPLSPDQARIAYRAACLSRALDRQARVMQRAGQGFYTIGSSGHEGMAAVALGLRAGDMALLHYRDAAFQIARALTVPGQDPVWDMLLSFAASSDDPISGGRHKVLGSRALMIPPQTSTIASHLPKAVGAAYSLGLMRKHRPEHAIMDPESVVMCSFGDASLNHSTAQGALNAAGWAAWQGAPLPLLFVCEDNGIGISTKSPPGWVEAVLRARPGLAYHAADGLDLYDTYAVTKAVADTIRRTKKPAILHLRTVRLYGHAGADVPTTYLPRAEVESDEANDPLLHAVRLLDQAGVMTPDQALSLYQSANDEVVRRAEEAILRPRLHTAAQVMASITPPSRLRAPRNGPSPEARVEAFGNDVKAMADPQPMSRLINWALTDLMLDRPETVLMGEDVGRKGGVYGVTQKLQARFGSQRVIDTLLDEQSILGLAIGMGQNGFVPIPEIQFLAYLHNAEDQIRGEAATLPFFSNGQFTNPMVLRIAGLGYQKGFGGHFHNDNSLSVLRDIPGLIVACPSRGDEAVLMLRECARLAAEEQRVVVFVEPIALYPARDLHAPGDGLWMQTYPAPGQRLTFGEVGVDGDSTELAIVTYGNGVMLSHQARKILMAEGVSCRIIDLRWISPLPEAALLAAVQGARRILVVDECRRSGNLSEAVMTLLAGHPSLIRVTAEDSFIATGPAYAATLPSASQIAKAALQLFSPDNR
ncbi:MFS transporter [Pseudotabrizicola sediminis]|uniref:2-oxoglutarate dehydrogenase E1 component n=1 Tax=Pseudotabrizicola sediminis TaxID=2486418 RepID=A0ABY2KKK8_9RHOB|nr:thiamine pyrophosphate-dependent enzyme [Pseudotabrizicola sediminis]TGD43007.1 MFS transporter [Pseudotabrizicola sediminis]